MRLGCAGCLTAVAFWSVLGAGVIGTSGWLAFRLTQDPVIEIPVTTQVDNARARGKMLEIFRRRARPPRGTDTVVFSERELNALIARQLAGDIPLSTPVARLPDRGVLELAGRLPVRQLLAEPPLSAIADLLPEPWLDRPVWVTVRARVTVEQGGRPHARLQVHEFEVGRQRLPILLLRLMLDPASLALLRLPLPDGVDEIRIEPGQVVIRTVS